MTTVGAAVVLPWLARRRRRAVRNGRGLGSVLLIVVGMTACGGGGCDAGEGPDVCAIEPAIAAVQEETGDDVEFYEISVDADVVRVFVKADDGAIPYEYSDGELTAKEPFAIGSGQTFRATAIDFDPAAIFDQVRAELGDPAIVDFAITGGPDGTPIYDTQILSEKGGNLLVRLTADGAVIGVQAD